jgi:hypothetical protein
MTATALLSIPADDGLPEELVLADIGDKFLDFNGYGQLCVWQHNPTRPQHPVELIGIDPDTDMDSLLVLARILGLPVFEGLAAVLGVRPRPTVPVHFGLPLTASEPRSGKSFEALAEMRRQIADATHVFVFDPMAAGEWAR